MSRVACNPCGVWAGYDPAKPVDAQGNDLRRAFPTTNPWFTIPATSPPLVVDRTFYEMFRACVGWKKVSLNYSINVPGTGSFSNSTSDSIVCLTNFTPALGNELDLDSVSLFQPEVFDTGASSAGFTVILVPLYDPETSQFSFDYSFIECPYLNAQQSVTYPTASGVVATILGESVVLYQLSSIVGSVVGTFDVEPSEWWPYIGQDGLPAWDSSTGERLITPTPQGP